MKQLRKSQFSSEDFLQFTAEGANGLQTFSHSDLNPLFPKKDSRRKASNLVKVVSFPCADNPIPLSFLKVELVQNCKAVKTVRSFFSSVLTGGCNQIKLHIRRVKIVQMNPNQYSETFLPGRKSTDRKTIWFNQKRIKV